MTFVFLKVTLTFAYLDKCDSRITSHLFSDIHFNCKHGLSIHYLIWETLFALSWLIATCVNHCGVHFCDTVCNNTFYQFNANSPHHCRVAHVNRWFETGRTELPSFGQRQLLRFPWTHLCVSHNCMKRYRVTALDHCWPNIGSDYRLQPPLLPRIISTSFRLFSHVSFCSATQFSTARLFRSMLARMQLNWDANVLQACVLKPTVVSNHVILRYLSLGFRTYYFQELEVESMRILTGEVNCHWVSKVDTAWPILAVQLIACPAERKHWLRYLALHFCDSSLFVTTAGRQFNYPTYDGCSFFHGFDSCRGIAGILVQTSGSFSSGFVVTCNFISWPLYLFVPAIIHDSI